MKENSKTRIRIVDIAGLAGVSAGTVDRVLHNREGVSEKTRERVMDIITRTDFRPDILASTLASRKTLRIAALVPRGDDGNRFWKYPMAGIEDGLLEIMHFGVALERYYFDYYDRHSFISQSNRMLRNQPHGVIMASVFAREAASLLERCNALKIPVVLVNASICSGTCLAFVGQDPVQSGMVAGRLMHYGTGSNARVLVVNFIRGTENQDHILQRENGFRRYWRENDTGESILQQVNIVETGEAETMEALERALTGIPGKVNGIFVTNSRVFIVAKFLESRQLPKSILIGYDLLDDNRYFLKRGTVDFLIGQKPREQGYKSIMTLYYDLVLRKNVERNQYLPVDIITRENLDHYTFV